MKGLGAARLRVVVRRLADKLGLADRAALRHRDGIRKGSGRRSGKEEGDMTISGHISQIARTVQAPDRARTFWRDTLGLTELYAFPELAFIDLGGIRLMLRETGQPGPADIAGLVVRGVVPAPMITAHGGPGSMTRNPVLPCPPTRYPVSPISSSTPPGTRPWTSARSWRWTAV